MRIAQIAPLFESVPPRGYGGTERVVSYLIEALVELGHDVTLYASGDSRTSARLVPVVPRGLRHDGRQADWLQHHLLMLDQVFEEAGRYDVLHFHTDLLHPALARRSPRPCVTTLHGRLDGPGLDRFWRRFRGHPLVSISDSQRLPLRDLAWRATIAHGLPRDLYRLQPEPQDYFAFVGRVSPEKRLDRAIAIAIACDTPLRIAAKIDEADRQYFEQCIRPQLDHPLIEFVGEIGEERKNEFIGNARALLFPIDWPEPFGIVMIEAMACGTPVLAWRCGSVPEVIEHGVSGLIVDDRQQAVAAAREIGSLDRRACRAAFERRFDAATMAARYVEVYRGVLADGRYGGKRWLSAS